MKLDRKEDFNVLYQVYVFRAGRKNKRPSWPLTAETFSTSPLKPLNGIQRNLYRKQDLNVLYQVCVFWADRKNKMAALASDCLKHFRLLLWNHWTKFKRKTGRKISTSSTKFVIFGPIGKTRWPPWLLIGRDIFDFSSETTVRNSTKLDRKQDLNVLYQVCVVRADRKNKMAALASDWLRHFRLLLWDRWTEFNETWQEARSQCPLPSLCFSGQSVNKNVHLGRFLKKVAHCNQVHDMWPFGPLVCRLRSIAAHRDHFVRRLSVHPCVCPVVTLSWLSRIAMFRRWHMHSSECCHYVFSW